jgi:hypothetical protein
LLASAIQELRNELGETNSAPAGFFCLTAASFTPNEPAPVIPDLLRRIDALLVSGGDVLLFRQRELYHMTALVNHYTTAPVRFVVGLSLSFARLKTFTAISKAAVWRPSGASSHKTCAYTLIP